MPSRSKNWCFTSFEVESMPHWDSKKMNYLVFQKESSPKTNNLHWQGYVQFIKRTKMITAKNALKLPKAHMEVAKGSAQENIDYCTKEDTRVDGPWIQGEPILYDENKGQGKRTDIEDAAQKVLAGEWKDVDHKTYVKYHKGLEALYKLHVQGIIPCEEAKVRPQIYIRWYEGPSGYGKTTRALYEASDEGKNYDDMYLKHPGTGEFWREYKGQKNIIIDNFNLKDIGFSELCTLLDHTPHYVKTFQGMTAFKGCNFWITATQPPANIFASGDAPQIDRRINHYILFNRKWDGLNKAIETLYGAPPEQVDSIRENLDEEFEREHKEDNNVVDLTLE